MEDEKDYIDDFTEDEVEEFRYFITSYGVDYSVDRIVNRLDKGSIIIPEFQRKYVWDIKTASRFIESLILGLPVPGVFFTQERDSGKMLVIDGQQRLVSLQRFYKGSFNDKTFRLKGVQNDLEGKSIDELKGSDRLRLDDCVIHATVVKQDSPDDDGSSIYMVFERLNTGGMKLTPQEIRACVYHGAFNRMLAKLSSNDAWKKIYGAENNRLKSEELILRFFALSDGWKKYKKGLKGFLNTYMEENKNICPKQEKDLVEKFTRTIEFIYDALGEGAFRLSKNLNAAIYDSVMIATDRLLNSDVNPDKDVFIGNYKTLLGNQEYLNCVKMSTSSEVSVSGRCGLAIETFVQ